jgi:hypothetical protein
MATDTNSSTLIIAPRFGHQRACRNIRLGLDIPRGHRFPGLAWYRQRRRQGRWVQRPLGYIAPPRPRPCVCCGSTRNPKGLNLGHCATCRDYLERYLPWLREVPAVPELPSHTVLRARVARPLRLPGDDLVRKSRQRPHPLAVDLPATYCAWWHRPRTRFCYSRPVALYLHRRRSLARQARKLGFVPVKPGIWYDQVADVAYVQSAVGLEQIEHVRFGGAR